MKHVYAIESEEHSDYEILAVFSTYELAEAYRQKLIKGLLGRVKLPKRSITFDWRPQTEEEIKTWAEEYYWIEDYQLDPEFSKDEDLS